MGNPKGLESSVSDAAGQAVGRVQYDPYGEVITSTLPVDLTDRLFTGLDSRLGLVYHGDGRYYDPAIAHNLQPNPLGGVPHLPQTLNRYAIPVGVVSPSRLGGQTGYGGGFPWATLAESALSNSLSNFIVEEGILGPFAERLISRAPWCWLSIKVVSRQPKHHIRRPLKNLVGSSVANQLAKGELGEWSGVVRVGGDEYVEWASRLGRRGVSVEVRSIAGRVWGFGPKYLTVGDLVPGMGADLLVGGLWQLGEDVITHPELLDDPWLLTRRAGAGAMSNVTTGLMGTGIAGGIALGLTAAGVTVAAPVVVVGGIAVTIIIEVGWGEQIEGWWLERLNTRGPW